MTEAILPYTVVSSNDRDRRVFFEGTENDARAFVLSNYPRPHVEPGQTVSSVIPDVYVVSPDGAKAGYDGTNWDDETDTMAPEPTPVTSQSVPVDSPEVDPDVWTSPTGERFKYDPDTDSMVKETDDVDNNSVSRPSPGLTGGVS